MKKIKVSKRFVPLLEDLIDKDFTMFVLKNGDLGYLKRLEKSMGISGDLTVEFDRDSGIGRITRGKNKKISRKKGR